MIRALLSLIVVFVVQVHAQMLGQLYVSSSASGIITLGFGFVGETPPLDYPFANFELGASNCGGSGDWAANMDENGYPNGGSGYPGSLQCLIYLPNTACTATNQCVIKFVNTGAYQLFGVSSGSLTVTSTSSNCTFTGSNVTLAGATTSCRAQFYWTGSTPDEVTPRFPSGTYSGMAKLEFCLVSNETACDNCAAGQLSYCFNPDFVSYIQAINPATLRFLAWNDVNDGNNVSNQAYRTPVTAATFGARRIETQAFGGTASYTSSPEEYTISTYPNDPGNWVDKETFQGYITNANTTTTPEITIGSRTPKTLILLNGNAVGVGNIAANAVYTFTYDAAFDEVFVSGGGMTSYVPIEMMTALANVTHKNLWFNFPPLSSPSDYQTIGQYVARNLSTALKFFDEYGDEPWNTNQFVFAYVNALTTKLNLNGGEGSGWGYQLATMYKNVAIGWGGRSGLVNVMAPQTCCNVSTTQFNNIILDCEYCNSTSSPSYTGPNYSTTGSRPIDYAKAVGTAVLSLAPYYNGTQTQGFYGWNYVAYNSGTTYAINAAVSYNNINYQSLVNGNKGNEPDISPSDWTVVQKEAGLLTAADECNSGDTTDCFNFLDADIRGTLLENGYTGGQTLYDYSNTVLPSWNTYASSIGVDIDNYEGAWQFWYPTVAQLTAAGMSTANANKYGGPSGEIASAISQYKLSSMFQQLVHDQFTQFMANSQAVSPAVLESPGLITGPSQFGVLSGDLYSMPYTAKTAIENFDNGH
jgi:hypothetical protein